MKIASNSMLSNFYMHLARDLDVVEPKTFNQVCKDHLEESIRGANLDSAKANLA